MFDRPALGLAQLQEAMAAMLEEASKQPDQPVGIALVDDAGDIVSYARMDNCRKYAQRLAIKKAYTASMSGLDAQENIDRLKSPGRTVSDYGDPNMAAATGGVVIRRPSDGAILGGIGVSGAPKEAAEGICRVGLRALKLERG